MTLTDISPRKLLLFGFLLIIALYSLFQARFLILGPRITVNTPANGSVLDNPVVLVSGRADNVAYLSLDGRQIYTDEKGLWSEKLIAPLGPSIMTIEARDRFGRRTVRLLNIYLTASSTNP